MKNIILRTSFGEENTAKTGGRVLGPQQPSARVGSL